MSKRTDAIRKVLDLIDSNPGVMDAEGINYREASIGFGRDKLDIHLPYLLTDAENKVLLQKIVKAFGGNWSKRVPESGGTMYFEREDIFGYFSATIYVERTVVCERKVLGKKTVSHEAVEAREAFVEVVEDIEWECMPLLGVNKENVGVVS